MKTWLITGATSGFGLLMAQALLDRGDQVAAASRNVGSLDDLKARHGDRLFTVALDLSNVPVITGVVDRCFERFGRIDVVVNNAGYGAFGAAEELSDEDIRRVVDTNLVGSIHVIRAALPHLRAQGGGRVIQVSSEGGQIAYPAFSIYHATKWGIEGFVESVAQEVAPFGIEFTITEPGPTETGFRNGLVRTTPVAAYEATRVGEMRRAMTGGSFARPGDPEKIAQAMIASADQTPAPRRIAFGRGSYDRIRSALVQRLAELDERRELSISTDRDVS